MTTSEMAIVLQKIAKHSRTPNFFWTVAGTGLLLLAVQMTAQAQCLTSRQLYGKVVALENNAYLAAGEKRIRGLALQKASDSCRSNKDSAYARLLHRIGLWEFLSGAPNDAISHTRISAQINTSGKKGTDRKQAINSYYNLGYYYADLNRYADALGYYDLCIITGSSYKDSVTLIDVLNARMQKAHIYYQTGDYQKAIEETTLGLRTAAAIKNVSLTIGLLNEQAQAYAAVQQVEDATAAANKAAALISNDDDEALANNYKIKATISEASGNYGEAMAYHGKAIQARSKVKDTAGLAGDYLDAGNTLRKEAIQNNSGDYAKAIRCYKQSFALAQSSNAILTAMKALNNLAAFSFRKSNYQDALSGYHASLQLAVARFKNGNTLMHPTYRQCNAGSDKNFLSLLLANKTECLLHLYKQSGSKPYLAAALSTALLTDSLITDMRHQQAGEQSKLYWRSETREFFTNAIEACYQANDANLAFYFMEKSRAVLLNDKLNELGTAAQLPAKEGAEEQKLQIAVFAQQQRIAELSDTDPAYEEEQVKLFAAKEALDRYIKTLQANHAAYYQYKYADDVPVLGALQKQLVARQSFVHYFFNDTAVYILAITPASATLIKQRGKDIQAALSGFVKRCSNIQALNNQYDSFAMQAFKLYQTLFEPLHLPAGRVIICHDAAAAIPFEAFTTDRGGKNFLINNYAFSYVYSARFLLKKFSNPPGRGQFLGVAPVFYAAYLNVQPLNGAQASLANAAEHYGNSKLLTHTQASCRNFLTQLPRYTIAAVFSHARADSTDKEPLLFMADSVIRLSELQQVRNPATELIVLSACQTNAGKMATGEGIFSLARGFAAAGIPAIAATSWKADEEATYGITKLFLQNIANGMRKDDALQQAKLSFMQNGATKNKLPYYWANIIIAGNAAPVTLANSNNNMWWISGLGSLALLIAGAIILRKKSKKAGNGFLLN